MAHRHFAVPWLAVLTLSGCAHRQGSSPAALPANPNLQITLALRPSSPRQLDPEQFTVTLRDARGQRVSGADVTADLTMPAMEMGNNRVTLTPQAPGTYTGTGRFTMPGDWQVTIVSRRGADRAVQTFSKAVQ